ncbi:MAG: DNA-binding transcriptional regulator Fis [Gammaproteobacteria bacterium]|nr:DNA-binding transcriptional regulator Fis [Gammaproteobacteria bacterium]
MSAFDTDFAVKTETATATPIAVSHTPTLRESVQLALNNYFAQLDGQPASNLYDLVLAEVEAPMLETVMSVVRGNQTKAAEVLGLNRGTLRKKLKQYGLN